jgi:hypothetical protein
MAELPGRWTVTSQRRDQGPPSEWPERPSGQVHRHPTAKPAELTAMQVGHLTQTGADAVTNGLDESLIPHRVPRTQAQARLHLRTLLTPDRSLFTAWGMIMSVLPHAPRARARGQFTAQPAAPVMARASASPRGRCKAGSYGR